MDGTGVGSAYALGHSKQEMKRLATQAEMFEPATRQMLQLAGLTAGMRVLDIGSGNGDVALLAAELVGPSGTVTGLERSGAAIDSARRHAIAAGWTNVRFLAGDVRELPCTEPFDAAIGRLVLMHQPDPVAVLRNLPRVVRPGGVIAFQEFDLSGARSHPRSELYEQCLGWIGAAFQRVGTNIQFGNQLYSAFVAAGLPRPEMNLYALAGGGAGNPASILVPEVLRSLMPVIERFGIATAAEVGLATLRDRLDAEIAAGGGIIISPSLVGAWTRLS